MDNCSKCEHLIAKLAKYKHYKKRYVLEKREREKVQRKSSRSSICSNAHNCRSPTSLMDTALCPPLLINEFVALGREVEGLLDRNEELERKLHLLKKQHRHLTRNFRPQVKSETFSSQDVNGMELLHEVLGIQENIEGILASEVSYLRGVVHAQHNALINCFPYVPSMKAPNDRVGGHASHGYEQKNTAERGVDFVKNTVGATEENSGGRQSQANTANRSGKTGQPRSRNSAFMLQEEVDRILREISGVKES